MNVAKFAMNNNYSILLKPFEKKIDWVQNDYAGEYHLSVLFLCYSYTLYMVWLPSDIDIKQRLVAARSHVLIFYIIITHHIDDIPTTSIPTYIDTRSQ